MNWNYTLDIINVLANLATLGAFLFLFKKDKNIQVQINKLTEIAETLQQSNEISKSQNDLLSQQIDILRAHSSIQELGAESQVKLAEIEEKKFKLNFKPLLQLNGAITTGYSGEIKIRVANKGEDAIIKKYLLLSEDINLLNNFVPIELHKGGNFEIIGRSKGVKGINECEYHLDIYYSDKLKNNFCMQIDGKGTRTRIVSDAEIKES